MLIDMRRSRGQESTQIPIGYTQVQFIRSTGTQYINTGIYVNNTIDLYIHFGVGNIQSVYQELYGCRYVEGTKFGFYLYHVVQKKQVWDYNSTRKLFSAAFSNDMTLRSKQNEFYFNGNLMFTAASTTFSIPNNSLYLFANNCLTIGAVDYARCKMYECTISLNGSLVRNYVPVVRDSDGAAGLFDLVSNTFFGNAGTGNFQLT